MMMMMMMMMLMMMITMTTTTRTTTMMTLMTMMQILFITHRDNISKFFIIRNKGVKNVYDLMVLGQVPHESRQTD